MSSSTGGHCQVVPVPLLRTECAGRWRQLVGRRGHEQGRLAPRHKKRALGESRGWRQDPRLRACLAGGSTDTSTVTEDTRACRAVQHNHIHKTAVSPKPAICLRVEGRVALVRSGWRQEGPRGWLSGDL